MSERVSCNLPPHPTALHANPPINHSRLPSCTGSCSLCLSDFIHASACTVWRSAAPELMPLSANSAFTFSEWPRVFHRLVSCLLLFAVVLRTLVRCGRLFVLDRTLRLVAHMHRAACLVRTPERVQPVSAARAHGCRVTVVQLCACVRDAAVSSTTTTNRVRLRLQAHTQPLHQIFVKPAEIR